LQILVFLDFLPFIVVILVVVTAGAANLTPTLVDLVETPKCNHHTTSNDKGQNLSGYEVKETERRRGFLIDIDEVIPRYEVTRQRN